MAEFGYVGRRDCGCVVVVMVDDPKDAKYTAKEISDGIRNGLHFDRYPLPEVRAMAKGLLDECDRCRRPSGERS